MRTTPCGGPLCPYCESIIPGNPELVEAICCEEMGHAYACGSEDEGRLRLCPECEEREGAAWAAHFGLRPSMSRPERLAQLETMRPQSDAELAEVMAEARRLK